MTDSLSLIDLVEEISDRFEHATPPLFYGHGTDNPWDEAVYLVLCVMDLAPESDRSVESLPIPPSCAERIRSLAEKRIQTRTPLPYLLQKAYFKGLPFYVDERVLIPRSAFGELILNRFFPWITEPPKRILEIGTGSGCMAILTALVFEEAEIIATDFSEAALEVAKKNISHYQLENRIQLIYSDLFESIPVQKFDVILSNPPYVDEEDMNALPEEYLHEPALALASGKDGLDHTRKILHAALTYLSPTGTLFIEVGNSAEALEQAYPKTPFTWIEFQEGSCEIFQLPYAHLPKE